MRFYVNERMCVVMFDDVVGDYFYLTNEWCGYEYGDRHRLVELGELFSLVVGEVLRLSGGGVEHYVIGSLCVDGGVLRVCDVSKFKVVLYTKCKVFRGVKCMCDGVRILVNGRWGGLVRWCDFVSVEGLL